MIRREQNQPKNKFYLFLLFQLANIGHQLKEEIERVLTMISQFAFIHGDTNLLCLALLRRPPEPPLTLGKVIDTKYFKHWTFTVQPSYYSLFQG